MNEEVFYNSAYVVLTKLLDASLDKKELEAAVRFARNALLLRTFSIEQVQDYFSRPLEEIASYAPANTKSRETVEKFSDYYARRVKLQDTLGLKYFPRIHALFSDIEKACDLYLMRDQPTRRLLHRGSRVITVGSCFAQNIARKLEGIPGIQTRHWGQGEEVASSLFLELVRSIGTKHPEMARDLAESDEPVVVYTIGNAEILYDEHGTYSVGVLKSNASRARNKSARVEKPAEIAAQLTEAFALLRDINPATEIVLTLSPVPLEATFQKSQSIVAADCLSKSALRYAISECLEDAERLYYFPSFEFVRWMCPLLGLQAFAEDDGHPRHVSNRVVAAICYLFVKHFGEEGLLQEYRTQVGDIMDTGM